MASVDRIKALRDKHAALEEAINAEERRPGHDTVHLKSLKRQKLRLKDEMSDVQRTAHA